MAKLNRNQRSLAG